jgi:protein required for attachment to host cells
MSRTCIVVVDAKRARFFTVEAGDSPRNRATLVERETLANPDLGELGKSISGQPRTETNTNREAGPVHPIGARRERHRLELERRFGREIARVGGEMTAGWKEGTLMLIAEPRLLGLTRACVREALPSALTLKELARNYSQLSASELRDRLDL